MSNKSKIIKDVVKKNSSPQSTYGTDPNDPWSAKAGITENSLLDRFLKSRGYNPEHVPKNVKVAHSKTGIFQKWLNNHISGGRLTFEPKPVRLEGTESSPDLHGGNSHVPSPTAASQSRLQQRYARHNVISSVKGGLHSSPGLQREDVDEEDTVTMDIPLLIRMLELSREDIKSDAELHKIVSKLIQIRNKGTLTMDDYNFIVKLKEELQLEDKYQDSYASTQTVGMEVDNPSEGPYSPKRMKSERSKSARIIKSIYKKKRMMEDLYDWEKDDKPDGSNKKTQIQKPVNNQASIVVTGGKTMTGSKRDEIEVDPMLSNKYGPQYKMPNASDKETKS